MSLRVSFELTNDDLKHFQLIMRESRKAIARSTPEDIVATAEGLLRDLSTDATPGFIQERIDKLRLMIRMLTDLDWRLPHHEATRVLNALAYFTEPEDLIPDHIPGLGFLDDAIMVELVMRELEHEIEAYQDFCEFRSKHDGTSRDDWINEHREELQARMRHRREESKETNGNNGEFSLFD
jgi:uncharacterized membrane protein YkvA (DUF1232 family)